MHCADAIEKTIQSIVSHENILFFPWFDDEKSIFLRVFVFGQLENENEKKKRKKKMPSWQKEWIVPFMAMKEREKKEQPQKGGYGNEN